VVMIKSGLAKINKKALDTFDDLYSYMYINAHHGNNRNAHFMEESFQNAKEFIGLLKPYSAEA
jgi:selenocysteine lyase/cysteine desulfurase